MIPQKDDFPDAEIDVVAISTNGAIVTDPNGNIILERDTVYGRTVRVMKDLQLGGLPMACIFNRHDELASQPMGVHAAQEEIRFHLPPSIKNTHRTGRISAADLRPSFGPNKLIDHSDDLEIPRQKDGTLIYFTDTRNGRTIRVRDHIDPKDRTAPVMIYNADEECVTESVPLHAAKTILSCDITKFSEEKKKPKKRRKPKQGL